MKKNWNPWGQTGIHKDKLQTISLTPLTSMTLVTCNGASVLCHRAIRTHTPDLGCQEAEKPNLVEAGGAANPAAPSLPQGKSAD